jgi:chitinase
LFILQESVDSKNLFCYFTNWAQYRPGLGKYMPDQIDPFLCNVIIYAFAEIEGDHLKPYEWNDLSEEWMKGDFFL